MKPKYIVIGVVAAALVAGGGFAASRFFAAAADDAVALVPQDAVLYANVFLDPSTDQKQSLRDLLKHFPDMDTPEEAGDFLSKLFDDAVSEGGLDYQEDIEPWLGKQIAFFFTELSGGEDEIEGALLVATDDEEATRAAIEKSREATDEDSEYEERSYEGVDYEWDEDGETAYGFVSGFFVAGSEQGFKDAVDASAGESLLDSDRYSRTVEGLTEDRLALFYFDGESLIEDLEESGELSEEDMAAFDSGLLEGFRQPASATLFATDDALVVEGSSLATGEGDGGPSLLPELPSGSWLALGMNDFGTRVEQLLSLGAEVSGENLDEGLAEFESQVGLDLEEDFLSWMDDVAFFLRGTTVAETGGGFVISSSDPDTSSETLRSVGDLLTDTFGLTIERETPVPGAEGFSIADPLGAGGFHFAAKEDRVFAIYGDENLAAAVAPSEKLADDELFGTAQEELGSEYDVQAFLDFSQALDLAEIAVIPSLGADEATYTEDVKPNLEALSYLIVGSTSSGETTIQRWVLGLQ